MITVNRTLHLVQTLTDSIQVLSPGADPGFKVRGAKFGEGSGDRLGPQSGPGAKHWGWGPGGGAKLPGSSCN